MSRSRKLADTWNLNGDVYLYFKRAGYTTQIVKILSVVDQGNGLERVTVDTVLADWVSLFASAAFIYRLNYVRLADDTEKAKFISEGSQVRTVQVIELPQEYTAYETGTKKIFLYHFWCKAPMDTHWRYTNFAANVASGNQLYSAFPMQHGSLTRSGKLDGGTVEITAEYSADHPFSLFLPVPFSRQLNVEIYETTYGAPEAVTKIFTGIVLSAPEKDGKIIAPCSNFGFLLKRKVPGWMIGGTCPYCVFDVNCKLNRARYETSGTIDSYESDWSAPTATVVLAFPDARQFDLWQSPGYFDGGFLQTGFGTKFEEREIISSSVDDDTKNLIFVLNAPLFKAGADQWVQLIPGCDGLPSTCKTKYRNYPNFGGFPAIPTKNPTLDSIQSNVSSGGKGK